MNTGNKFTCYTLQEIAEILSINPETVRLWIKKGELQVQDRSSSKSTYYVLISEFNKFLLSHAKYHKRLQENKGAYLRFKRDLAHSIDPSTGKSGKILVKEQIQERDKEINNTLRNTEYYFDTTVHNAVFTRHNTQKDAQKLANTIYYICCLAGFEIKDKLILIDKETGKQYS